MENQVLTGIIIVSAAVFVIATIFYDTGAFKKLLCRAGFGVAGVLGANRCLSYLGLGICVGLNPVSMLVLLALGAPGMLLLYGVEAYCRFFP